MQKIFSNHKFLEGLKDGLPIALGYLSVSFTFGLMATEGGLSPLTAVLISLTNLTSAGQFAGTELIIAGGSILELILTTFIINMRYMLMSFSLSQKINPKMTTLQRLVLSFGITDEVFAVASGKRWNIGPKYFSGLILLPIVGWSLGTFIGASATTLLPVAIRSALGIAIYGMFIAIIIPPAKKSKSILTVILIAVFISVIFRYTPILNSISGGFAVIIATLLSAGLGAFLFPQEEI